ncbi:MAG: phenylalanine--tRNA ligase subunit beta [Lentisphaerae bacterium]|nr:phenylalanine--tRNA ligase subunit beta [Lentisphaerota bacterium]
MLECGQPLHAFDRRQLREGRIIVRRARGDEQLVTLDGEQHKLAPEMLVIADAAGPVALAGIMGGEHSGVLDDTENVVLESACFDRAGVRRTTRLLGLHTESSARFERGVDRNLSGWAARRAAALLAQLAGGRPVGRVLDLHRPADPRSPIACRYDRIRALLGIPISDDEMIDIFRALELQPDAARPGVCMVTPPSFRGDLETEADLTEEVARIHGLDRIATPTADLRRPEAESQHRRALAISRLRDILTGMGLSEIMNYSFTSEKLLGLFNGGRNQSCVPIANPLTADHGLLRQALTPQLVETLGQNRARQVETAAVFEIGRVFFQPPRGPAAEADRLALGLMGPAGRPELDRRRPPTEEEMLLWIKGILTGLCRALKFAAPDTSGKSAPLGLTMSPLASEEVSVTGLFPSIFAPQRGFELKLDGRPAGVAGLLQRELRRVWRINEPLAIAEIAVDPLLAHLDSVSAPQPAPVYPAVRRDLALRVLQNITHEQINNVIARTAPKELTDVELFDIFEGGQIGKGYKSMAYCLTYRATERTLTDDEVNRMHEQIVAGLRDELRVEVRDGQA